MNDSKLPHSLRIVIFLLRIVLGLNFLFNPALSQELESRSANGLQTWFGPAIGNVSFQAIATWVFIVIGACLILGIFTRITAAIGVALVLLGYLPGTMSFTFLDASRFANEAILIAICLLVLIFSKAGEYLGLDRFIHVHLSGKHKK